jgi:hypothetical protein
MVIYFKYLARFFSIFILTKSHLVKLDLKKFTLPKFSSNSFLKILVSDRFSKSFL